MKLADIEVGKTYWFSTRTDWAEYEYRSYDRYPVRVESLERYAYQAPFYRGANWHPDQSARKVPKGRYLRVIVPGDPESDNYRTDTVAYVEPRNIRAELDDFRRIVADNLAARKAKWAAQAERRQAADDRVTVLDARIKALGLTGVSPYAKDGGAWVTVSATEAALVEILDRLERAEGKQQ